MREHGASLDGVFKQIFEAFGKEYKYSLAKNFDEVWNELETVVGKDLKQDLLGIIPTQRNSGGVLEQPIFDADAKIIENKMTKIGENSDGSLIVEVVIDTVNGEETKRGVFANGVLNFEDTVGVSGANQLLSPEMRDALNRGETVEFVTYFDPSHGVIGDIAEATVEIAGYYTGGKFMTGNAKKLADLIRKNPEILSNYVAHSKGAATTANAILDIINSGDGELLKGKRIRFNGAPINLNKMERLAKEYGFEFEHVDNAKDPVTNVFGFNRANSNNEGHTTKKNNINRGYSRYQKKKTKYKIEIDDEKKFHNVNEIRKLNEKETNSQISNLLKRNSHKKTVSDVE